MIPKNLNEQQIEIIKYLKLSNGNINKFEPEHDFYNPVHVNQTFRNPY